MYYTAQLRYSLHMLVETQERIQEARLQAMRSREMAAESRRSLEQLSRELEIVKRQLLTVMTTNSSAGFVSKPTVPPSPRAMIEVAGHSIPRKQTSEQ